MEIRHENINVLSKFTHITIFVQLSSSFFLSIQVFKRLAYCLKVRFSIRIFIFPHHTWRLILVFFFLNEWIFLLLLHELTLSMRLNLRCDLILRKYNETTRRYTYMVIYITLLFFVETLMCYCEFNLKFSN